MSKKYITLSLILLLAGSAALGLGLLERQKEQQQLADIRRMLDRLENVSADDIEIQTLAQVFSGSDWQKKLDEYNKYSGSRGLLIDTAIIFILTGGIIFVLIILYQAGLSLRKKYAFLTNIPFLSVEQAAPQQKDLSHRKKDSTDGKSRRKQKAKIFDVLRSSGWVDYNDAESENILPESETGETQKRTASALQPDSQMRSNTDSMFSDAEKSVVKQPFSFKADRLSHRQKALYISEPELADSFIDQGKLQKALALQKKSLEKHIAEFRKMVQTVEKTGIENPPPFSIAIKELMQQLSAIREYAIDQQDRVRKLQEGYDWNIIKSFGLKVIRCIDNIEQRLDTLDDTDGDYEQLSHIRDELIFALESSGIEQYRPQINSDYKGQERTAETVRERAQSNSPSQKGRIAQVLRPGYRHFIDDENFRIIRTARVKLFN